MNNESVNSHHPQPIQATGTSGPVPIRKKSLRQRILFLLAIGCCLYLSTLVVLLALEDTQLYPGAVFSITQREPRSDLAIRQLHLTASDGTCISAWFTAPTGWKPSSGAILYSHGNGSNLSWRQGRLQRWRKHLRRAVLVYDYPGYGESTGRPSESGCYAAAEAAWDWLVDEQKVPPREVILLGSSLGTAMSTELAVRHENRLLVLINPFTSFPDMAQLKVPWAPSRWLVHNHLDTLAKIDAVKGPVFIASGTADRVVPIRMGKQLYRKAHEPKYFLAMAGQPHQHPFHPEFFDAVREFLKQTSEGEAMRGYK
jgi:pimeloyl-ACP methyl ester carboxylesterase